MIRFGGAAAAVALVLSASAHAADPALSEAANQAFLKKFASQPGVMTLPSGLEYKILHSGFGARPGAFNKVQVAYKGQLINGTVFDSTEPGLPATFTVNQLIPGWTEALEQMREGDHWEIAVPSNLAYGARGAGGVIPPNQTLVFDLELLKVMPPDKDQEDQGQGQQ